MRNRSHDLAAHRIREDSQESTRAESLRGLPVPRSTRSLVRELLRQFGQVSNEQNGMSVFAREFDFIYAAQRPAFYFNECLPLFDPEVGNVAMTVREPENVCFISPRESTFVKNLRDSKFVSAARTKIEDAPLAINIAIASFSSFWKMRSRRYAGSFSMNRVGPETFHYIFGSGSVCWKILSAPSRIVPMCLENFRKLCSTFGRPQIVRIVLSAAWVTIRPARHSSDSLRVM